MSQLESRDGFIAINCASVKSNSVQIAKQVSPDLTVYVVGHALVVLVAVAVLVLVAVVPLPATHNTCPTSMLQLESSVGLSARNCASIRPNSVQMAKHVSPDLTV